MGFRISSPSPVRPAAVAGLFYPADPRELSTMVDELMHGAPPALTDAGVIIAPHAGYIYSGPTAAIAYSQLAARREATRRVLLLGPSHRVPFRGLALSSATWFETPLGDVAIDETACRELEQLPQVAVLDDAHAQEHSLEVHLPFLQRILDDFRLVPVVVGDAAPDAVAQVIECFVDRPDTVVVVSSDLSHFLDYDTANRVDRETTHAIEHHAWDIRPEQACGCRAINGLMKVADARGMRVTTLDLRNSGDTAGDRSRVVGYGAYALT